MKKDKVNLDTILVAEIGEFGKYQIRTLVLSAILAVFAGWIANEYVFTTARINTRCLIPECDGAEPEWSPDWISNAIPATSSSTYDNCQRFANTTTQVESNECPSSFFDTNTLRSCEAYVYENTLSVAYDFELACDEWRRSLIGTMRSVGLIIGLPITGYVSDRWGRRVAVTLAAFNKSLVGILRSFSSSYIMFMLLEAIESIVSGGCFYSCYILLAEVTSPRYRVAVGGFMNTCMAIGFVTLGLIAWAVPNWRHLTLALYIPQLITLSYFWIISESVRWYIAKGRFSDAEAVLRKVAKSNGKELSETSLQALWNAAEEEKSKKLKEEELRRLEPLLIVQVWRHKRILVRCIVAPIWWMTSAFVYNGLSLNAVSLAGNSYLNYIAVAAVEIPGYWFSVFLMEKIGRKPVLIGAYWTCAACQIAYVFIADDLNAVLLIVYLIGKFSIAMVGAGLFIYTVELFPTRHRNSLISFTTMLSKLGAMLAPLTPAIGAQWFEDLPFLLYAGFALLSGVLVFLTPETLGCRLPDTFEEASTMKRQNKTACMAE